MKGFAGERVEQAGKAAGHFSASEALGLIEDELEKLIHVGDPSANYRPMSREMPYQPMRGPRKDVSFEQMQAILKKHAPQACEAELLKAGQSPQVPKAPEEQAQDAQSSKPVRWRKIAENSYESDKGPVLLAESGKFIVFDRITTKTHTAQRIGGFTDRQTALDFVRLLP